MKTSAKKNVSQFVNLCSELGLKHIVVSPGSRNAPLSVAFNQHEKITCTVIPDERSAGFVALGMALQLQQPVALLCTSGSAAVNYYPAIVEAYYQSVPLIAITADRPQAWVNEGDGQTIVQARLFHEHVRYEVQFEDQPETSDYAWYLRREVSRAFIAATQGDKGPVHLNFALSEPLYGTTENVQEDQRIITQPALKQTLHEDQQVEISSIWRSSKRKMILCGQMPPDVELREQLKILAQDPSVLILVENTSNLCEDAFVHCIDRSLNAIREDELARFAPDLLLTLGGAVVSKRIKSYLRKYQPAEHWKIGAEFPLMDTYQCLTRSFPIRAEAFFALLEADPKSASDYGLEWKRRDLLVQQKAANWFRHNTNWCDITVFALLLDNIPAHSVLHLGNSSVVRYAQLFDPIKHVVYRSNRGTSGIDGSTSTAIGAAATDTNTVHTLISGDMSFFYDSNAFWNHLKAPNFRVFVIHNGGGGIFKIIPGPDTTDELNDFFVFNNAFGAESICKAFDVAYYKADSFDALLGQMSDFYAPSANGRPKLMEISTQGIANEKELQEYFEKMKLG